LTGEDLTDLALLRLDMIVALNVNGVDGPGSAYSAHLLPDNPDGKVWEIDPPSSVSHFDVDFLRWIQSLEDEFQRGQRSIPLKGAREKAILISVGRESRECLENSMEELKELAESSGVFVVDSIIQRPQHISPTTLMGEGKLKIQVGFWTTIPTIPFAIRMRSGSGEGSGLIQNGSMPSTQAGFLISVSPSARSAPPQL
jgi:GTP-binding protein HflX